VARAVDVAEVARRLLGNAVELGGVRVASEAVGSEGRLVSAIETENSHAEEELAM
jgi:DNA-binding protein